MSRLLNPSVQVMLDKERHLCFGAAAFIEFKDYRGQDLLLFMRDLGAKFQSATDENGNPSPTFEMPLKDVRDVLWAGLVHEDEDLTPKQVGNLFSLRDVPELIPQIMEAFALGLPETPDRPRRAPVVPSRRMRPQSHQLAKSTGAASTD
jgi:hypothetical protein